MQSSRRLLAAASSGQGGRSAWSSFKSALKSRFMVGDTYEPYIPPRPEFMNRDSKYTNTDEPWRAPSPGNQPEATVPRGYPETEFNISLAKRASLKLTPSGHIQDPLMAEKEAHPGESSAGMDTPRHVPMPSWMHDREALKRLRRFYLETGVWLAGVPNYATVQTYRPVEEHGIREDWENVEVIRDVRKPRV